MYKHILVPVDGSPASSHGLHEAIALAARLGATLKLFHIIDPMIAYAAMSGGAGADLTSELREAGQQIIADAHKLAADHGVTVETAITETAAHSVADLIVEQAKAWPADMIVMGTHGRRGLTRLLMGSDAEMVLRNSPVPVLMVRSA